MEWEGVAASIADRLRLDRGALSVMLVLLLLLCRCGDRSVCAYSTMAMLIMNSFKKVRISNTALMLKEIHTNMSYLSSYDPLSRFSEPG